jgi:hypothetical protein
LLGAGTLNALADNHGGKGHGGGSGKVEHQDKQQQRAEVHHDVQSSNHAEQQATVNDDDRRGPDRDDDDDLVTPPARVTDEVRPGKGCGDENHVHLRHDECKDKFQGDDEDDDQMEVEDD